MGMTEERRLSLLDSQTIPLVTDTLGVGICFVSGASDWVKALAAERQKNTRKTRRKHALPHKPAPQKHKTPEPDTSDMPDGSDGSNVHTDTESANEEPRKEPAPKRRCVHSSSQRHVTNPPPCVKEGSTRD